MRGKIWIGGLLLSLLSIPFLVMAQETGPVQLQAIGSLRLVTNHVGYETDGPKRAVIIAENRMQMDSFRLVDMGSGQVVYSGKAVWAGPVDKWKHWVFWTIDFTSCRLEGTFRLEAWSPQHTVQSYPFAIARHVLERNTISDLIYYFKGQRSSGLLDQADRHIGFEKGAGTTDAHGGWYDATGDYGKHLSHLSFSTYFNPQQISLTVWSLEKSYEWLSKREGTDYRQYLRRLLDEATYGADYLARVQVAGGSFYRSIGAPGPGKLPKDRIVSAESLGYRIKQSKEGYGPAAVVGGKNGQASNGDGSDGSTRAGTTEIPGATYQCSYRSGGGMAIAALALASTLGSTLGSSGEYNQAEWLRAAERAFAFLEKNNPRMTNDGKENIVDDYCALMAATELYKATREPLYLAAADRRARRLMDRLGSWKEYHDYWRADDMDRPFFHPSDAGLPLVSLLNYYPIADTVTRMRLKETVRRSLQHELAITQAVVNPFGYSRQLVQDTAGRRWSAFFFPHGSEASPWWQGENARLGSMAAAARMAAGLFAGETSWRSGLERFATDQLNWILGLNPFDACMMQGVGHNNPVYGFFGTFEYTNAPGGIVNGITSGLQNENDIDFNLSYAQTGKDYDWRWAEQWLPHASWFLLAVCATPVPQ